MNELEKLEQEARDDGVNIDYINFESDRIKGLYCDGSIAINRNMLTTAEKTCVLSEELGHYYTSSGDILDLCDVANRKQEYRARMWGYDNRIGLIGIVNAFRAGCRELYDMADYLGVTEEYLKDALDAYRRRYGECAEIDNYIIFFEPHLGVMKRFE